MKKWLAGWLTALFCVSLFSGANALEHPCVVHFQARLEALVGRGESESFRVALYTRHGRAFGAEMRVFVQECESGAEVEADVSVYRVDPESAPVNLLREEYILMKQLRAGDELAVLIRLNKGKDKGKAERCTLRLNDLKQDALPYYRKMLSDHQTLVYDLGIPERAPWNTWDNRQYPGVEWDILQRVWTMVYIPVIGATEEESGYRFIYQRPEDESYHGTNVTRFEATVLKKELLERSEPPGAGVTAREWTPERIGALNARLNRALVRRARLTDAFDGGTYTVSLAQPESREQTDGVWTPENATLLLSSESAFAYELYLDEKKIAQGEETRVTDGAVQKRLILTPDLLGRARRLRIELVFEAADLAPQTHTLDLSPDPPQPYRIAGEDFLRDYKDYLAEYPDWTVAFAPMPAPDGVAWTIRLRREGILLERGH